MDSRQRLAVPQTFAGLLDSCRSSYQEIRDCLSDDPIRARRNDLCDFIEAFHEELIKLRPSEFGTPPEATKPRAVSGCSGVLLVMVLIVAGVLALIAAMV